MSFKIYFPITFVVSLVFCPHSYGFLTAQTLRCKCLRGKLLNFTNEYNAQLTIQAFYLDKEMKKSNSVCDNDENVVLFDYNASSLIKKCNH
jgi:hypothetical protein